MAPLRQLGVSTIVHQTRRWCEQEGLALDVPVHADDVSLLFVPYWRYEAMLAGWLLGTAQARAATPPVARPAATAQHGGDLAELLARARGRGEEARLAAYVSGAAARVAARQEADLTSPRTSAVLRQVSWSGPACDVREFGLIGIHQLVADQTLVPFDFGAAERSGTICQVTSSVAAVRRQAERAIVNQLGGRQRLVRRRTVLIRERLALIYYPLYKVKYRVSDLRLRLVMDGLRGHILAGSRPSAAHDERLPLLGGITAWGTLLALHPAAGLGSVPAAYFLAAAHDGRLNSPAELARRAQSALTRRPPHAERF